LLQISEMHFSEEASRYLSQMKGRTGLTPNILARIGFCLSLEDPTPPDPADYEGTGHISIKRHVLTGYYDPLFEAMLKERCFGEALAQENGTSNGTAVDLPTMFRAHMNRGVVLLNKRLKSLDNLLLVLPPESRQTPDISYE
jgi:DNA sulfur modification protein DndE